MAGINIIRRWVMSQMTKKSDDGIMITLPDMKKVEINTNITIEKFLQNGVNPNAFTNIQQVDNVVNQLSKPKVISQDNPLFKGVMNRMMGKNVIKKDFGPGFKKEVEKMKGKVDDDLPPPGSRGGKDDIAAPVQSAEEATTNLTDSTIQNMLKMEPIEAMKEANKVIKREGIYKALDKKQAKKILEDTEDHIFERNFKTPDDPDFDPESMADGGRIGYKKGSVDLARRGFMKAAAGVGAGIGALKMGALKLFGKEGAKQVTKNVIKTDSVPGKPEWFDALVTKVINEGENVTKRFATQEREIVHKLDIDKFEDVTVYRNMDTGEIRVSYESPTNVGEQSVDLVYKKPLPDEGDPRPSAEFYAVEPEPRVVNRDGDMEMDGENLVNSVDDLMSDTSKLKIIAKGDAKPTLKEFVTSKRKKESAKKLNEDPMEQAEYIENKYGPGPEPDFDDIENFVKGGLARLRYQMGGDVAYDATDTSVYGSSAITVTPDTVMDQFGNQVQAEMGNNFNKPLIPQVTEQAGNRPETPVSNQTPIAGAIEQDIPVAGGNKNEMGILPVEPVNQLPGFRDDTPTKMPGGPPPEEIKYNDPLPQDQLMSGFAEWKQKNPDKVSYVGTQAIKYMILPNGEPITFSGGAEASNMARYLESIGQPPMKPGNQTVKSIGDPYAKLEMALASGGIARMLGE